MWLRVALIALTLGVAGDILLRHIPWGFGTFLWTALFVVTTLVLLIRHRRDALREAIVPAVAALLAAAGLVWRDSEVLYLLDLLLLAIVVPLLAVGARGIRAHAAGLMQFAAAHVLTLAQSIGGFVQLMVSDIRWSALPRGTTSRTIGVAFRGTLIALPALILFGALLGSADPAFASVLREVFDIGIAEIVQHIAVTLLVGAACAGFFRSVIAGGPLESFERPQPIRIPAAETNVALGLIDLLFLVFVIVQFRYFFGGASLVRIDPTLSYSDYARRGFFELAWVVTLALPMLLIAEWLVDKTSIRITRALIGAQIVLILVIATSAFRRMQLYRAEFGLTELRFYTTAFMIWIAVLLVWFAVTVLSGHRERFALGALVSAVVAVVVLHAVNPDARIVETNLARRGVRLFDAGYALRLSDDATPILLRHLDILAPCAVSDLARVPAPGWRTWNYGRASAVAALSGQRTRVERMKRQCQESNERPPMRERPVGSTR